LGIFINFIPAGLQYLFWAEKAQKRILATIRVKEIKFFEYL
jgi:hypothetical protein